MAIIIGLETTMVVAEITIVVVATIINAVSFKIINQQLNKKLTLLRCKFFYFNPKGS